MLRMFKRNGLTKFTGIVILMTVLFTLISEKQWNDETKVINGDVKGYYGYLPAHFINDDLKLERPEVYDSHIGLLLWYSTNEDGTRFIKYTTGMSILYSPFFFAAHAVAESIGEAPDGYSVPYRFALVFSAFFYLIIGVVFLSKLLLRFFSDSVTSLTLLIIFAGSNAFQYYTGQMTYSHGYSLALISVFLYCVVRWLEKPKLKWAVWIGITSGLFVLIRPIDIIFLLAIPLFDIRNTSDLKERFCLFWRQKGHVIIMLVAFFLMLIPQFLYFKLISGSYIFYSYTGESFYFSSPHIFDSIFSYRNGWLVYSPLMILSIFGLFFLRKQKAHFAAFIVPAVILYIYVISSWWCWWYVGFGNRAFINLYPLLAISLAAFIQFVLSKKAWLKFSFKLVVMLGLILSVFQSYQFNLGVIHWGAMTKEAYWDSFFRTRPSQLFESMLRFPVTEAQIEGKDLILEPSTTTSFTTFYSFDSENDCDSTMISGLQYDKYRNGKGAIYLPEGMEFLGKFPVSVDGIDALYISAWVHNLPEQVHLGLSSVEPFYYHSSDEVVERSGDWSKIHLHAWVPNQYPGDSIEFILWNQGKHELVLDDLEIKGLKYTYSEKER